MRKWSRGAQYSSSYRRVLIGTAPAANSLVQHTHCFLFVFGAPLISAVLSEIVFRTRAEYGNYVSFVYVLNGMVKMKYIFFFRLRYLYILQASWTSLMLVLVFFFFAHTRAKNEIILIIIIASFFPSVLSASTLQFLLYSAFISSRPFSSTLNNMQWTVKTLPITDSDSFGQWKKAHFLWFHSVRCWCWCCRYGHLCVWAVSFQPRQRFTPMQLAIITIMTVEWR